MNVQTERIDNHRAQFTVEIDAQQLDEAKQKAAKRLARQVRIKGFRKGKAPYRIIAQYVGEAAILEEAVELLGNDIYKVALEESEVEPYGPGMLDDFKIEPAPTFIFSVPLQPEVDLKDYLDVRADFEAPEVTDEEVEEALQQMRQQEIEVLDDEVSVVEAGHRVTVDIHSEFIDGEEPEDEDEDEESDDVVDVDETDESDDESDDDTDESEDDESEDDDDTPYVPKKGDNFLHQHDMTLILDEDDDPVVPGFVAGLIGAELDEEVVFEVTVPEGVENFEDIVGRKVEFHVTVSKIEVINLPELDDELAKKISESQGEELLDLDGLRKLTREQLEQSALQEAKSTYGDKVLDMIAEGADIAFPEMMVEERIEDMIEDLDQRLQQQGINLDSYMRITGQTKESLQEQYRDSAVDSLRRTLVLREIVKAQNIEVGDEEIEKRLDTMMIQFGSQGDQFRNLIDTPQMRDNILNELMMDNVMTRLVAIGRDEDPEKAIEERAAEIDADNEKMRQRVERMIAVQEAQNEALDVVVAEEASDDAVAEAETTETDDLEPVVDDTSGAEDGADDSETDESSETGENE